MNGAAKSLQLLRARQARTLEGLAQDLAEPLPAVEVTRRVVATGTGGSEGPARAFVAALQEANLVARFRPLSSYLLDGRDPEATLVLFSQGLSPNARLALGGEGPRIVVTAVDPEADDPAADALRQAIARGAALLRHGPSEESGLLVRIEGPSRATLAGLRLAAALGAPPLPGGILEATRGASGVEAVPLEDTPVAFVTAGDAAPYSHGLRWKLLEGLGVADPPVWDVLQVAHGPLQQFYEGCITLLCLERPAEAPLFDRLAFVLDRRRHRMRRLKAHLPHPFSWFEHDAQVTALLVATLAERPRDLVDWPGKGRDASLYDLSLP